MFFLFQSFAVDVCCWKGGQGCCLHLSPIIFTRVRIFQRNSEVAMFTMLLLIDCWILCPENWWLNGGQQPEGRTYLRNSWTSVFVESRYEIQTVRVVSSHLIIYHACVQASVAPHTRFLHTLYSCISFGKTQEGNKQSAFLMWPMRNVSNSRLNATLLIDNQKL